MIFTGLSPNAERDDVLLALWLLARPWTWRTGGSVARLEQSFRDWLQTKHAFAFESGRTGLYAILSTLGLRSDDEVLLQAYTCVAVPNAVRWAGAQPVYVDVDDATFNMLPDDLELKITPKSRALIIQHTFGNPADLRRLLAVAKRHGLFVIEDCAHALGGEYAGQRLGTFGDAAFFSFGRDKVISGVFGGLATTNRDDTAERLRRLRESFPLPGRGWVAQQLAHPIITSIVKATYDVVWIGRLLLTVAKRLRFISKAVYPEEKRGERPYFAEKRMPNALAALALRQFAKLARFNAHRRIVAGVYEREFTLSAAHSVARTLKLPSTAPDGRHVWLRYTVRTPRAAQIRAAAKREGILLGDWYDTPLAPAGTDLGRIGYRSGSCLVAERLARESLNLPTDIHLTEDDARRVAACVTRHL